MADLIQDSSRLPAAPPAPPGGSVSSDRYQPLSLLALSGFVLAVLYASAVVLGGLAAFAGRNPRLLVVLFFTAILGGWLVALARQRRSIGGVIGSMGMMLAALATLLGLGSLVAFSGSTPWLLPDATWILVVAALLTCWLARSRIAASEGTLGGASLARWGLGLSLFFALNYGAYLASTTFAVRTQAREAALTFLDLVKKGELDQAFVRGLPPRKRPGSGGNLRQALEGGYNAMNGPAGGDYSSFQRSSLIRLIELAGPEATFEPIGIASDFQRGGYEVSLTYRVHGALGSFDINLVVFGQESTEAGAVRRQWHVEMNRSSMGQRHEKNQEGETLEAIMAATRPLATDWAEKVNAHQIGEAYLLTLDPAERQRLAAAGLMGQPALIGVTGLGLLGGMQASASGRETYRKGKQAFEAGSILDSTDLYPPPGPKHEHIIALVKKVLIGQGPVGVRFDLPSIDVPLYRHDGDKITISYPVQIRTIDGDKRRIIEAELDIVGPHTNQPVTTLYRVYRLRLLRPQESGDAAAPKRR